MAATTEVSASKGCVSCPTREWMKTNPKLTLLAIAIIFTIGVLLIHFAFASTGWTIGIGFVCFILVCMAYVKLHKKDDHNSVNRPSVT